MRRLLAVAALLAPSLALAQSSVHTYRGAGCADPVTLDYTTGATGAPFCFDLFVTATVGANWGTTLVWDVVTHAEQLPIGLFAESGTVGVQSVGGGAPVADVWTFTQYDPPLLQTPHHARFATALSGVPLAPGQTDLSLTSWTALGTVFPAHNPDPGMGGAIYDAWSTPLTMTPEPASLALVGSGVLCMGGAVVRRRITR